MNKNLQAMVTYKARTIITVLLALIAMKGHAQVKCHVVGTVADGVERQTYFVAQQDTADDDDAKSFDAQELEMIIKKALNID